MYEKKYRNQKEKVHTTLLTMQISLTSRYYIQSFIAQICKILNTYTQNISKGLVELILGYLHSIIS